MFLSLFGLMNSFHGQVNNNPGALRVLTVMSLWPLFYSVLSSIFSQEKSLFLLNKLLIISLSFVVFYSFYYLGYERGFIPASLYIELDQGQISGFYNGFVEYNLYSISSLLFLIPFLFHYAYHQYQLDQLSYKIIFLLVASFLLVILTGRRAVLLVLLLSPGMILVSNYFFKVRFSEIRKENKLKKLYAVLLVIFFGFISYGLMVKMDLNIDAIKVVFLDGFDFESGDSTPERTLQFHSLIDGWLNSNILFGVGNGGSADYSRSEQFSWAYELTYVYLLFSTGIVGVMFYFSWFFLGLIRVKNSLKDSWLLAVYTTPLITGVFGMGLGAASNPYFGKFDYLWIIMLPHLIAGGLKYQKLES